MVPIGREQMAETSHWDKSLGRMAAHIAGANDGRSSAIALAENAALQCPFSHQGGY